MFVALLLGGGAVAAVALTKGQTPDQQPEVSLAAQVAVKPTLGYGSMPGATITQLTKTGVIGRLQSIKGGLSTAPATTATLVNVQGVSSTSSGTQSGTLTQEQLDVIATYGKAAYDNMSADAKTAAAKALSKELKLDPPLTGDEDWDAIAKIAGGAAGAAAFSWAPGGVVWGPIVGAYFGVKIEEFFNKSGDEIKNWFRSRWSDIDGWVEGKVSAGYHEVVKFFGAIF